MDMKKFTARLTAAFGVIQVVLILFSWIVSVVDTGISGRSLLSTDGIRWFFGTFADNVGSVPLVWMVLLSVGWGAVRTSGLYTALCSMAAHRTLNYRSRYALVTAVTSALLMVLCVLLLTFLPHALLLSVTGSLWPSPFSSSLVPVVSFIMVSSSVVYGLQSGVLSTVDDVFRCLYSGLGIAAPLFPLYIVAVELLYSIYFVFGI